MKLTDPVSSTDIPADELTVLADAHDVAPERRDAFQKAMNWAAFKYGVTKNLPLDIGKVKAQTGLLTRKAKMLIKAVDGFNEALHDFDDLSENPVEKRIGITLRRNVTFPNEVKSCRELVKADAERWRDTADQISAEFEAKGKLKKNLGDPAFRWLLATLMDAFEAGGKKLARSVDSYSGENTGPMFRFICDCLHILGVEKEPKALGSAIRKELDRRKALSEQPF